MVDTEATLTGTSKIYYHNGQQGFLYSGNPQQWLGGIAFKRCLWERRELRGSQQGRRQQMAASGEARHL